MIISMMLFTLSCSTPSISIRQSDELNLYKKEYIKIGILFEDKLPKNFYKRPNATKLYLSKIKEENILAMCFPLLNEIHINEYEWKLLPTENKEELIFHEMTHCAAEDQNHRPLGIMVDSGLMNPSLYRRMYKYLINELFYCETRDCVNITYKEGKYL